MNEKNIFESENWANNVFIGKKCKYFLVEDNNCSLKEQVRAHEHKCTKQIDEHLHMHFFDISFRCTVSNSQQQYINI